VRALLVAVGGAAGSVLRFWASGFTQEAAAGTAFGTFPLGTLVVNVVGCALIGMLAELGDQRGYMSPDARALLVVGFLGGFTTFSAFANETVLAWRSGAPLISLGNVVLSLALCLGAVLAGRSLVAALVK
jgi:CrcB protein